MLSYAQNFEDVMLWRALGRIERGFYIDIGAQDPVSDSVSLAFYESGWRGLHVEPTPEYATALRAARPEETVLQSAVGLDEAIIPFYQIIGSGISTGNAELARRHERSGFSLHRIDVPCVRLSSVLDTYAKGDVHWMKIDVEGMEASVLRSWAPSPVRPWIVVVEATVPLSREPSFADWEPVLLGLGYRFLYFDGLNRFYVSLEHDELSDAFKAPPNVFDDFALAGTAAQPFCVKLNEDASRLRAEADRLKARVGEFETAMDVLQRHIDAQEASLADGRSRAAAAEARLDAVRIEHSERLSASEAANHHAVEQVRHDAQAELQRANEEGRLRLVERERAIRAESAIVVAAFRQEERSRFDALLETVSGRLQHGFEGRLRDAESERDQRHEAERRLLEASLLRRLADREHELQVETGVQAARLLDAERARSKAELARRLEAQERALRAETSADTARLLESERARRETELAQRLEAQERELRAETSADTARLLEFERARRETELARQLGAQERELLAQTSAETARRLESERVRFETESGLRLAAQEREFLAETNAGRARIVEAERARFEAELERRLAAQWQVFTSVLDAVHRRHRQANVARDDRQHREWRRLHDTAEADRRRLALDSEAGMAEQRRAFDNQLEAQRLNFATQLEAQRQAGGAELELQRQRLEREADLRWVARLDSAAAQWHRAELEPLRVERDALLVAHERCELELAEAREEVARVMHRLSAQEADDAERWQRIRPTAGGRLPTAPSSAGDAPWYSAEGIQGDAASPFALLTAAPDEENPMLDRLLALNDVEFVRAAYLAALHRDADAEGERAYLAELRVGVDKIILLRDMTRSDEGKAVGAKIDGLTAALRWRRAGSVPFLGPLLLLVRRWAWPGRNHDVTQAFQNQSMGLQHATLRLVFDVQMAVDEQRRQQRDHADRIERLGRTLTALHDTPIRRTRSTTGTDATGAGGVSSPSAGL